MDALYHSRNFQSGISMSKKFYCSHFEKLYREKSIWQRKEEDFHHEGHEEHEGGEKDWLSVFGVYS